MMLCIWWDQEGVIYYELIKPGETVNADPYRQQLIDLNHALLKKRPQYKKATQVDFAPRQCSSR